MWSSATASSSPVLTPGRTAARTAFRAPAVTSPEARISSISCAVLTWIMRPLHFPSSGTRPRSPVPTSAAGRSALGGPERAHGPLRDLLDRTDRLDAGQQAFVLVEPRQRGRLFPVDAQAVPNGLGLVVVALNPLAVDEHAAAGQPTDQLVLVDDELEHAVQPLPQLRQRLAQLLGLGDRPREAVEQEPGLGGGLG